MTISIQCEHCHKRYNAPGAMAGKKVKCKHCGKIFAIPLNAAQVGDSEGEKAVERTPGKSRTPAVGAAKGSAADEKLGHPGAGFSTKVARNGNVQAVDLADSASPAVLLRPSVPMDFP